jgi:cysteine synthase B
VTHFVSAMGTTGTIMGVSRYLKEQNPAIQIVGVQPEEGSRIPGIRRWPEEYLPGIFDAASVDLTLDVSQQLKLKKRRGSWLQKKACSVVFPLVAPVRLR